MQEHTCSTGCMIAIVAFLLLLPVGLTQQPKPGGTLWVAWEAESVNISFHNTRKPFDDVRVRQALGGYGIDRHTIAKTAMLGLGQALWSFVPPRGKDHIVGNMVQMSITTLPFIQAAREYVKGYVCERGLKIGLAATWLDKP